MSGSRHGITGGAPIDVYNAEGGVIIGRNGSAINLDTTLAQRVTHIENRGLMVGDAQALAHDPTISDLDGDAVDIDALASIENWGTIEGKGAAGLHNGEANVSEAIAMGGGSVINHEGGQIIGYGRAIQIDNSGNGGALGVMTITNNGLIRGDGHLPTGTGVTPEDIALFAERMKGGEAINIVGTFADTVINGVTGEIVGGTKTDGGDDLFVNQGKITATGGSAVNLGDGNDTFEAHAGSTVTGLIDGGAGDDTMKLIGPGLGSVGATANVENLEVLSGTWSVAGSEAYDTVTIESGAVVTSQINLSGADKLTIEEGGTLNVNANNTNSVAISGVTTGLVIDNAGLIHSGPSTANAINGWLGSDTQSIEIINRSTGVISAEWQSGLAFDSDYEVPPTGTIKIQNAGLIESTNSNAVRMQDVYGVTVTIDNLAGGVIRSTDRQDTVRLGGTATLNNAGTIVATDTGENFGDAVDFQNSSGGVVNNLAGGLIEGSRHGVTGSGKVTVTNAAEGIIIGRNGSAVNIDNGGSEEEKVFITNRGIMEGRSAELDDSDGDAIDTDGLAQIPERWPHRRPGSRRLSQWRAEYFRGHRHRRRHHRQQRQCRDLRLRPRYPGRRQREWSGLRCDHHRQ